MTEVVVIGREHIKTRLTTGWIQVALPYKHGELNLVEPRGLMQEKNRRLKLFDSWS